MAHLGLARAEARMNDKRESLAEYRQFLAAWKDGDADVPALVQASREYAELNSSP